MQHNLQSLALAHLPRFAGTTLSYLSNLTSLYMWKIEPVTDDAIAALRGTDLPHLQCLKIAFCHQLRGSTLSSLTNLTSLDARLDMTADSLANLRSLPNLHSLQLESSRSLHNDALTRWYTMINLASLSIIGAEHVNDEGVGKLHRMPCLHHLMIARCPQLQGTALLALTHLASLTLVSCPKLRGTTLLPLTSLTCLKLRNCPQVTSDCMVAFHLPMYPTFSLTRTYRHEQDP